MSKSQNKYSEIRYTAWVVSFIYRSCFKPAVDRFVSLLQKQVFLAVILITSVVGFRYYVLEINDMDAIAASVNSSGLPTLSTMGFVGGEIVRLSDMVDKSDQEFLEELERSNIEDQQRLSRIRQSEKESESPQSDPQSDSQSDSQFEKESESLPSDKKQSHKKNDNVIVRSDADQDRNDEPQETAFVSSLGINTSNDDSNDVSNNVSNNASNDNALEHAGKHADPTYICPMHPTVVNKDPNATCPICGMDLVIVENTGGEADIVSISPRVINMLGVRLGTVKKRTLYRLINSVGNIKYNENNISHIHLRTDGWVERLSVKSLGERVKKGALLFQIYSPILVNAQEELLQSLYMGNESLLVASRERLVSLGMSKSQIKVLEKTKKAQRLVSYYAPQSGVVSELNIREGMYVKPSESIVSLVDMTTIWLIANVFESQSNWVKVGDRAEAELSFMPGKTWEGKVEHVYPTLDAKTRSLEVRLRFDNPDESLKANMYANVKIFAKPKLGALSIPLESLIQTGDGDRVIVSLGEGKFKPVAVQAGIESNNRIEILNGLKEGDSVVVSSQFLIDSESSLRASLMRMSGS